MTSAPPPIPTVPVTALKKWTGLELSLLIPGAAHFFAGKRLTGIAWFAALALMLALFGWSISTPLLPGFLPAMVVGALWVGLWILMLRSGSKSAGNLRGGL